MNDKNNEVKCGFFYDPQIAKNREHGKAYNWQYDDKSDCL